MSDKPRNWKPFVLTTPVNHKSSIQLPADPQAEADKRAKLLGTTPAFLRSRKS